VAGAPSELAVETLRWALADPDTIARYRSHVRQVPGSSCAWWCAALSGRGHGRFWLARGRRPRRRGPRAPLRVRARLRPGHAARDARARASLRQRALPAGGRAARARVVPATEPPRVGGAPAAERLGGERPTRCAWPGRGAAGRRAGRRRTAGSGRRARPSPRHADAPCGERTRRGICRGWCTALSATPPPGQAVITHSPPRARRRRTCRSRRTGCGRARAVCRRRSAWCGSGRRPRASRAGRGR
jgi:hypothetical protein